MTLVKFNNGHRTQAVNAHFNDVFNSVLNDSFFGKAAPAHKSPAVNIAETKGAFEIEIAAPGLKKEDFKISLDKNTLSVAVEVKKQDDADLKKYNKKEFNFTSFSRSFTLPQSVDQSQIGAEYTDGILTLTLAKKEEAKLQTREIEVR